MQERYASVGLASRPTIESGENCYKKEGSKKKYCLKFKKEERRSTPPPLPFPCHKHGMALTRDCTFWTPRLIEDASVISDVVSMAEKILYFLAAPHKEVHHSTHYLRRDYQWTTWSCMPWRSYHREQAARQNQYLAQQVKGHLVLFFVVQSKILWGAFLFQLFITHSILQWRCTLSGWTNKLAGVRTLFLSSNSETEQHGLPFLVLF